MVDAGINAPGMMEAYHDTEKVEKTDHVIRLPTQ